MAGLIDELLDSLVRNSETRQILEESQLQKNHDEGLAATIQLLKESAARRDVEELLNNERALLMHTLKFDANSNEEMKSLEAAVHQLDESRECFKAIEKDPEAYRKMAATYPSKKKEAGLPLDAARDFFRSHGTRLANSLTAKGTKHEKLLLRQRKDSLSVLRDCYIAIQKHSIDESL